MNVDFVKFGETILPGSTRFFGKKFIDEQIHYGILPCYENSFNNRINAR